MGGQWTSPTPRSETIHEQRPRLAKIPTLASIHIKTPTTPMPLPDQRAKWCPPLRLPTSGVPEGQLGALVFDDI